MHRKIVHMVQVRGSFRTTLLHATYKLSLIRRLLVLFSFVNKPLTTPKMAEQPCWISELSYQNARCVINERGHLALRSRLVFVDKIIQNKYKFNSQFAAIALLTQE